MNTTSILHLLGWAVLVVMAAMLLPLLAAIASANWQTMQAFAISMLIMGFLGGALVLGFRHGEPRVSRVGGIVFVIAVWILLPLCAAAPLLFAAPEIGIAVAVFEMASGLTTTGSSAIAKVGDLPRAVILWRAEVQWLGGALTLLTVFLILTPAGISGPPSQIFLPGYERDHLIRSVLATTRAIAPAYGGLTIFCLIALWLTGLPGFDAICIAFSTVSTGGFLPVDGGLWQYGNPAAEFVISVFMVLGALSFVAHHAHLSGARGGHHETTESHHMIMLIIAAVVALTLIFWAGFEEREGLNMLAAMRIAMFRAISLLTTTGFDNAPALAPAVPFVVALTLMTIGGCAYSTAGGVKIYRLSMLWRQSGRELVRLVHPHGVSSTRASGRMVNIQVMKSVWVMFAVFILTAIAISMMLALDGLSFETALMAGVSALSNAGPTLDMTAGPDAAVIYPALSAVSLLVLAAGMILGRLELLVVLSMASAIYWRR